MASLSSRFSDTKGVDTKVSAATATRCMAELAARRSPAGGYTHFHTPVCATSVMTCLGRHCPQVLRAKDFLVVGSMGKRSSWKLPYRELSGKINVHLLVNPYPEHLQPSL